MRVSQILDCLIERRARISAALAILDRNSSHQPSGRPADLPSALVLGLRHKHGTKMRYLAGCRCSRCRRGNAEYEARLKLDRELYGPNDLVSSKRVLRHLRYLQKFGIGHKTVANRAHVAKTGLAEIIWYRKKQLRRRAESRILAIQPTIENMPISEVLPAGETLARLKQLTIIWGYPKQLINRDAMKSAGCGLQIRSLDGETPNVTVKTALKIRTFFELVIAMRDVWQRERGAIPARHYVYWKRRRGRPPTKPTIARLELRPFARTYDRTYVYPQELKDVISIARQLKKQIGRKVRDAKEQNVGSQGSPIRDARIA